MKTFRTPPATARAGFSLMELIVVLIIIVTIAGIAMPRFGKTTARSNDARRIADLTAVEKALEMYKLDHGVYPSTDGKWVGDAEAYGGKGYGAKGYIPGLVPDYMQMLPRDPDKIYPDKNHGYLYRSDGTNYKFLAWNTPTNFPKDHRFFDPKRPKSSYQVSSKGARNW